MFNFYNEEQETTVEEKQALAQSLIDRAEKGEHMEPETLTNIYSYKAAKTCRNAIEKVVYATRRSAKATMKEFIKSIETAAKVEQLLAYKALKHVELFYTEEFNIIQGMIEEYEKYMFSNPINMVDALIGRERDA